MADLTTDLDLFVLTSCDSQAPCKGASPTPLDLQTTEEVTFTSESGHSYLVLVDGYAGAAGTYSLQVDCDCQ